MGALRARLLLAASGVSILAAAPTAAQVQVGTTFNAQGPSPEFGNVLQIHSSDAGGSNGTAGGAIQAIVPDAALGANTLFAASPNGGIWVTNNNGTTWTPLTDKQATLSIASLALDPTDPTGKTLIAGTGITDNGDYDFFNTNFQGRGALQKGLLYTTNGGATWTSLGGATLANQTVIGVAADGQTILAATFEPQATNTTTTGGGASYGLYRSTNGGGSFSLVGAGAGLTVPGPVSSLVVDPSNPNHIYAAVSAVATQNATSIFASTNGGANWTQVFNNTNSAGTIVNGHQTSLTMSTGPNGSLAVGVINDQTGQLGGVFLSQDNGTTWHQLTAATQVNPGGQAPVNFAIKIDPTNANIVYITGDAYQSGATSVFSVEAFRLNYNPVTFASTSTSLTFEGTPPNFQDLNSAHADSRALAFDSSGRLIMTSDGGVYALTNPQGSGTWQKFNGNLSAFEAYNVAFDANSKRLVVAAQDNGVSFQSGVNNPLFTAIQGGDGANAVVNDRTLNKQSAIYTTFQQLGGFSRLVVDTNGNAVSLTPNPSGIPITCNGGLSCRAQVANSYFGSPVVLNRVDPSRIAIGGSNAYVTQDPLTNIATTNTLDLTLVNVGTTGTNPAGNNQQVTAMAYGAADNTSALIVGAGDRFGQGNLGTVSFSATSTAGTLAQLAAYAGLTPTSLVFDNRASARFFVADSAKVWGTVNTGTTFTDLTGNLPASFIRPTSVEFIASNGVNALLVGGLNNVANAQSPIVVADSNAVGALSNWRSFGTGLPNALIYQMVYNPTVDVLAVSSIGRSAWTLYDVTSNFAQATVLQFGLANNDSIPDASVLTNGTVGTRPLIKYGTGQLTIVGNATYTGGTTVENGVLQLGNGGAGGSILGNVTFCSSAADPNCNNTTKGKALVFNRSDTYTFGGSISGPGQVAQIGAGTVVLSGNSTYSGPTTVANGILTVPGSITSLVTVDAGGALGGSGSVGPTTILAGGTLAPGDPQTFTVNGNLTFNPGSNYVVAVQGNASDRTNATGTATLAGNAAASFLGGVPVNKYVILSAAAGRSGTFTTLSTAGFPVFLTPSLAYTTTDVDLFISSNIGSTPGLNQNQRAVGSALDASFNGGGGTLTGLLGLAPSQLPGALSVLSGEGITGAQETTFGASNMFLALMMDQGQFWRSGDPIDPDGVTYAAARPALLYKAKPVKAPAFEPRWRGWAAGFDGTWKVAGDPVVIGSADLSHQAAGGGAGIDYQVNRDVLLGAAAGGSSSRFSVPDRLTSGTVEGAHLGAYGVGRYQQLYAAGALMFGSFNDSTSRAIAGVGPTETATGNFNSYLFGGRFEAGWQQHFSNANVTPFAAVQFSELWQQGFSESSVGAGGPAVLGLVYQSKTTPSLPIFAGAQLDTRIALPGGMVWSPYIRGSWVHEFDPTRNVTATFETLPLATFTVDGARAARDAGRVELGDKLSVTRNAWLFGSFVGEWSKISQMYAAKGGLRVSW